MIHRSKPTNPHACRVSFTNVNGLYTQKCGGKTQKDLGFVYKIYLEFVQNTIDGV